MTEFEEFRLAGKKMSLYMQVATPILFSALGGCWGEVLMIMPFVMLRLLQL